MTYDRLTIDQFAAPPRTLPAPIPASKRLDAYVTAENEHATPEQLRAVFEDLGMRIPVAERLRKEGK